MPEPEPPSRRRFARSGVIAVLVIACLLLVLVVIRLGRRVDNRSLPSSAARPGGEPVPSSPPAELPPPAPKAAPPAALGPAREPPRTATPGRSAHPDMTHTQGDRGRGSKTAATTPNNPRTALPSRSSTDAAPPTAERRSTPAGAPPAPPESTSTPAVTTGIAPALPEPSPPTLVPPPMSPPAVSPTPGASPPAADSAVRAPAPAAGPVFEGESAILGRLLHQYEAAYHRLDAEAAAALWPSVDRPALTRAFARLRMQSLEFGNCTVAVSEGDATAQCVGVLRYAQRIGDPTPKAEHHVWTIEFVRGAEAWTIARITAQ